MAKKLETKPGRPKAIDSPEMLLELWNDYKKVTDANPWHKVDVYGKDANLMRVPLQVPYTWEGFDSYLFNKGILKTMDDYKKNYNGAYQMFSHIIAHIQSEIFAHNYTGAAIGVFNANLIARKLGIKDQTDITSNDEALPAPKIIVKHIGR